MILNIIMEYWTLNQILLSIITIFLPAFLFFLLRKKSISGHRLPPGPPGWPVFGNIFDLGAMPHSTLAGLKNTYGPILWLKLGSVNTMVVQSSSAAAELFKNHDIAFADRTTIEVMKTHGFYKSSVALGSYGTYWRVMKRLLSVEMMANKTINETVHLRRKPVDDLISWIRNEATNQGKDTKGIEVSRFVFLALFNMVGSMIFSRDLVKPESEEGMEFFAGVIRLMELSGSVNIVDLFPCLKWLDPQGLRRKADKDCRKTIEVVSNFVKQCLKERQQSGQKKNDYLQVLYDYEHEGKDEPLKITDHDINIHIMETFIASAETTSSIIEWAMVELISNPTTLSKLRVELDEVVGRDRQVGEDDIDNLKYLQVVMKETLRLHPPLPFLVPRRATQDTNFMGYDIPKDTQVFVNVFAIGRDTENWDDPESFRPERFLDSNIDFKGHHFELLPFGAGRRYCPGIPLAHRMLHLVVGSMMHEFEWDVHATEAFKIKDMREGLSIVARKVYPLIAIPRPK